MNEIKKQTEKEILSADQDANSPQYVLYSDYQRLNTRLQDLSTKYRQIKSENNELKAILNKIDENVTTYTESKENIEKLVKIVQKEYQNLFDQLQQRKAVVYYPSSFSLTIQSESNLPSIIDQFKEITEKYKALKDEHSKCFINKHCSTANSTNFKNEKYQSIKNCLFDHYFGSLLLEGKEESSTNTNDNQIEEGKSTLIHCEPVPSIYKCFKKCV